MTVKIGPKAILLMEKINRGESEEIAILRAEAALYKHIAELRQQLEAERCTPGWPTVQDWFDYWFHRRYIAGSWGLVKQGGGERDHIRKWRMAAKYISGLSMDSITPGAIRRMLADMADRYSANTVSSIVAVLKIVFADAVRWGWDDGYGRGLRWRARYNPMDGTKAPREPADRTILDDRLLRILLDTSERNRGMSEALGIIALQASLGLRIGEAATLRWEQVGIGDHLIPDAAGFIVWRKGYRKAGVPLRLPLPHGLLRYLPLARREAGGRVWTERPQVLARYVNGELRQTAREMDFPEEAVETFSSHSLRHSFANALRRADTDVSAIQQALGHANLKTTMVYLRDSKDFVETAAAVLPRAARLLQ